MRRMYKRPIVLARQQARKFGFEKLGNQEKNSAHKRQKFIKKTHFVILDIGTPGSVKSIIRTFWLSDY